MIYYEVVEKSFSNRSNIVPVTKVSLKPRDHQAYISMFGYGEQITEWLELNDTVKGYNGKFHLDTLYFDVDRDDLEEARKDTLRLLKHLYNRYNLSLDSIHIFFSGKKGFHIGLPAQLFGGFEPSDQLPDQIDALAKRLVKRKKKIKGVDLSIYNKNRLFRLVNSKHQESNLYKIPLSVDELKGSVDKISTLAEQPRPDFDSTINRNDIIVNDELKQIWRQSKMTASDDADTPTDSLKDGDFFDPPEEGERNNKLFKQATMLFDKGLDMDNVYSIIKSINQSANPPIDSKDELATIVNSAKRQTEGNKTKKGNKVVSDLVPTYLDYLSPTRRKLGLLFDEFSDDMRYKLRGKLIGVVGREGTKKSLYCQNVAYKNMRKHGARTILSNMEMGDNPLMSRLIDRSFSKYKIRPSDDMEQAMKEGKEDWVQKRLHLLAKHYNDKLIINSQSAMKPDDYRKIIKETEADKGKVDMLVVDGFSMMGGDQSDRFSRQETNSRELKEIAKDMDVCVLAIFHTNASAKKYWRKAHEYIRGTNKQKDNVDAFVSMSLCIDETNSHNEHDLVFLDDVGYSLLYNKRGTGNTIRSIYEFKPSQLKMVESIDDPHSYEVNPKNL